MNERGNVTSWTRGMSRIKNGLYEYVVPLYDRTIVRSYVRKSVRRTSYVVPRTSPVLLLMLSDSLFGFHHFSLLLSLDGNFAHNSISYSVSLEKPWPGWGELLKSQLWKPPNSPVPITSILLRIMTDNIICFQLRSMHFIMNYKWMNYYREYAVNVSVLRWYCHRSVLVLAETQNKYHGKSSIKCKLHT